MDRLKCAVALLSCAALLGAAARADVVQIGAVMDNTLYEEDTGALSNGAGEYCFSGKTGALAEGRLRRAVLAF